MGRFGRHHRRGVPALNTSSLPDLIFTLLFFFMIVANPRDTNLKVEFTLPQGTELERLERTSLTTFIYVGKPSSGFRDVPDCESRIQVNDCYVDVSDIPAYIARERAGRTEDELARMVVSLKVDQDTKMGVVADIKEALRKANALNILYAARKRE